MKKLLLGAIGLVALATPAFAADLPQREPVKAPAMVMPYLYDWTGFYIGANGGYGSNRACWGAFNSVGIADGCNTKSGGIVGGQAGYRWQFGSVVFGAEVLGDWANMRASLPSQLPGNPLGTDSTKVTSLFLFTGQLGYAWNAALLYLKGGGAMVNNNFLIQDFAGNGLAYATSHKVGATVGVGFEYGFTPNWSAGIEYDYLMMGNANNSFSLPAPLAAASNSISQNISMFTVRLDYKFGGPGVVARY
jgi:outer membrane immunogenic protein